VERALPNDPSQVRTTPAAGPLPAVSPNGLAQGEAVSGLANGWKLRLPPLRSAHSRIFRPISHRQQGFSIAASVVHRVVGVARLPQVLEVLGLIA
jgi:hypothetical protein